MSLRGRHDRAAFTLIDLIVSIGVMVVLISLLAPSLRAARESARRVSCSSNIRQVGYAMQMYASDFNGHIPGSIFYQSYDQSQLSLPEETIALRVESDERGFPRDSRRPSGTVWDGLGILIRREYLSHPGSFYCPSHHGEHSYEDYREAWLQARGEIFGNYQYRPMVGQTTLLYRMPPTASLIADGMRTQIDYNHVVGNNIFRADLSVEWFEDSQGALYGGLAPEIGSPNSSQAVIDAWQTFDGRRSAGSGDSF